MSVLTRIKNNQITDSTILANTKIVPGSIVGSLFNANLTMTSDVTITGNLTVQGSSTYLTVASTNTYVNDPLIVMNNAFAGTNTNDIGLLFNRGSDINQAFIWDESEDEFRLIATSESGDTYGAVTTSSFANLRIGNLNVETTATLGSLDINGNIIAENATLTGDLLIGGGDLTANTTTFNLLTSTVETLNFTLAATTVNIGASTGTVNLQNANIYLPNATTIYSGQPTVSLINENTTTVNFAGAATTLTIGATSGNTAIRNNLDVGLTLQAQDINNTVIGNVIPASATFTTATVQGNTSLGLTTAAAINNTPIGNTTPSTGSFTTLLSSGVTQVTDTSTATSIGTGAFRVDGGASVAGNLWVGGNINIVGESFLISGNTGQFFGDINGFGALYAGVTGFTSLPQTVLQLAADVNDYAQVNFENVNTGAEASTDYVATAGAGDDFSHYINMGITSGNWDGTQENSLKDAVKAHDGYLYVQGNVSVPGSGGNLVIGASLANHYVKVVAGGNTAAYTVAVFDAPGTQSTNTTTGALTVIGGVGITGNLNAGNLITSSIGLTGDFETAGNININATTPSTSSIEGALTVAGGVGIAGNLNVGEDLVVSGNLTVQGAVTTLNTATLDVEDLNITVAKGAADSLSANGAGLTVDGAGATILYTHATSSWDLNKHLIGISAEFGNTLSVTGDTTLTGDLAVNGGDVTTTAITANLFNATATTINAFGSATAINLGTTTGTLTINSPTVVGTQATQDLYNTIASTVNFAGAATTLTIGATSGNTAIRNNLNVGLTLQAQDINNTVIGNVNPAAATFTSIKNTALTSGRITFATTDGQLTDNANLTFSIDTVTVGELSINGTTGTLASQSGNISLSSASGKINANGANLSNIASPVELSDAVTLDYLQTQISSGVTTLISDNTDITVTDNGVDSGKITANVDAVKVFDVTANLTSLYTDFVTFDDANSNVAVTGKVHISSNADIVGNLTANGIATINNTTASSSYNTGALVVAGGVGVAGIVNLASGAVINETQTTNSFQVKGQSATTLIYADSTTDTVTIGGSNTASVSGATLRVNGTGAMILPIGTTSQRPGITGNVDVRGMMRFNSSLNIIEYYDGTEWQSTQGAFTVITSESLTGDGTTTEFALANSSTTSATMIAINGVLQIPVTSYSITGTTLTFTEPPEVSDIIDVRSLVSTSTVTSIIDAYTEILATTSAVIISTGTSSSIPRLVIDNTGAATFTNDVKVGGSLIIDRVVHNETGTAVPLSATPVVVDSFAASSYSSAKYLVQIKQGSTNVQIMEALLVHDGVNAYITTYGNVNTAGNMGTLTANIVSGDVNLYYTSSSLTDNAVKVQPTYIA